MDLAKRTTLEEKKIGDLTDRDRRGHVHMEPGSGKVEAQVSVDEEAGTAGRGVAAVRHRVLHVRNCRAEKKNFSINPVKMEILFSNLICINDQT